MRELDPQEKLIARELIRNPRLSDNAIAGKTKIPARTVSRKRHRLEEDGLITYYAALNVNPNGDDPVGSRHLYIIKFRLGITKKQIVDEIKSEPNVGTVFPELIYESHIAEIEGHIALVMIVEGKNDSDVVENMQGKIIPSLRKNHGADSILQISTLRLLGPVRVMHNYLPAFNMKAGYLHPKIPNAAIFVG